MRSKRHQTGPARLLLAAALAAALTASGASAEEVVYGPDGAPTVVQRKLYTMTGRMEVSLAAGIALNTALVDHFGGLLGVSYHPNEWFDGGIDLLGNYTALSGLADQIRAKLPARADSSTHRPNNGDEIANAEQLRGGAFLTARLAPIYGKFNLASELAVHFQAFALIGAGGAMVHRESINLCATAAQTPCPDGQFQTSDSFSLAGQVGGGLRLYLSERWSIHTEVRVLLFPDRFKEKADLTNPASGTSKTYLGLVTMYVLGLASTF